MLKKFKASTEISYFQSSCYVFIIYNFIKRHSSSSSGSLVTMSKCIYK
jgi:hypothetical protein